MSSEPLRHAPGPRDWSPAGGYEYDAPAPGPSRVKQTLRRPTIRRSRGSSALDFGGASLVVGLLSLGVAAFYLPETPEYGPSLYSAVGVLAVLMGIQSLRAHRKGLARRRWPAWIGIALGVVAMLSTALGVVNQSFGTALPTLPGLTSALIAGTAPTPDDASGPSVALDGPAAAREPVPEPPAILVTPVFASADEEFGYLAQSLGTAVFLIGQHYAEAAPESVFVSETGYSYLAPDGSVMVGAGEGIRPGYGLTGDGGYTLSLTGAQFGRTAYYDSRVGQIMRG